jgi:hypothetical protein
MQINEKVIRVIFRQANAINVHYASQVILGEFPQLERLLQDSFSD